MIDPVSLIGINVATGLLEGIFGSSQKTSSSDASFDAIMNKHDASQLRLEKAAELVGMKVRVENAQGKTITGVVEKVEVSDEGIQLQINGQSFKLEQLKNVLSKQHQGVTV